ncbi:Chromo domain/shadow and Chromo domain-like and Chromo domain-containing protein [Strongyloides ratti]|uniref:Chromo domain/shadow and Chromo domain-like and Chromo domain-containing protein n=1 Tax=Strongyloides ratti TaxID=34506 RepID=A0A090MUA3_STRRB|nr:Chromo domain/shadow and Chromo domain-like and Chromo domain-containing protein [Strongyloides ratti]CEF62103.1 Chromo domain/shadow and Chromo domain-like and Chromo domain-containing protein [Strongyloides ratti]
MVGNSEVMNAKEPEDNNDVSDNINWTEFVCRNIDAIYGINGKKEYRISSGNKGNKMSSREEACETSTENREEEEDEDETYEVEYIIDAKFDNDGNCKYLVKWKNYTHSYNTWEPVENFIHKDIINDFWTERRLIAFENPPDEEIQIEDFFKSRKRKDCF